MSNLTLVIDDELLRRARIKALQQGTSVNEICRDAIARYAALPVVDTDSFMAQLRALSPRTDARSPKTAPGGSAAKLPSRNEMMEDALDQRMPTLMAALAKKK